jgi:hypothetical protein
MLKVGKMLQTSTERHFGSRGVEFGVKPLPKLRFPEVLHLSLKHTFNTFLHAKGFQNASK